MSSAFRDAGVISASFAVAACVVLLELRRADRRRRMARCFAAVVSIAGLCAWAIGGAHLRGSAATTRARVAALWTASSVAAVPPPGNVARDVWFALPDAAQAPEGALRVPDVGYVRRHVPRLATLHVYGDGIDPAEVSGLEGITLILHPGSGRRLRPVVDSIFYPASIDAGDMLSVRGTLAGLESGRHVSVTLSGPDGGSKSTEVVADPEGRASFEVRASPSAAAGGFVWSFKVAYVGDPTKPIEEESLGVQVKPLHLPRLLALASDPGLDTARLLRWYAGASGRMTVRTLVSAGRYRFGSSGGAPDSFASIDAALLDQFDGLLVDAGALGALDAAQRGALETAVVEGGLGVLVMADPEGEAHPSTDPFFQPWRVVGDGAEIGDQHLTRLRDAAGSFLPGEPVSVPSRQVILGEEQIGVLSDGQARWIAAAAPRGRGRVATTLVNEAWRWQQEAPQGPFAAYWSLVLGSVVRRGAQADGSLWLDAEAPRFADAPMDLFWSGPGEPPRSVTFLGDRVPAGVEGLGAQGRPEPLGMRWDFWPRQHGWHRGVGPAGTCVDFWVDEPQAWPGVRAARRMEATGWLAATAETHPEHGPEREPAGSVWEALAFAGFLVAAAYLWCESEASRRS